MAFCSIVDLLYAALPVRPIRDWLIRGHMESCPHCQARLLSREEARGLLIAPDRVGDARALWPRIAAERERPAGLPEKSRPRAGGAWQLAAVAALAFIIAVAGFWVLRETGTEAAGPPDRFEISYVNVGGAPARTFVYQPQGSDTVFVWAQRTP